MRSAFAVVLLFAPLLRAGDAEKTVDRAYRFAKLMPGAKRREYAAEQAAHFDGRVGQKDHLYLAYLWQFASKWSRAADAFEVYIAVAEPGSKNREIAMLERARALVEAGRWQNVAAAVKAYLSASPARKFTGRMRFLQGRALRALGNVEAAADAFRRATIAGHDLAAYERIDCLVHLLSYKDAKRALDKSDDQSARFATLRRAMPYLGRTLPRLSFSFWAGRSRRTVLDGKRPTVFAFWSSKAVRANDISQRVMNGWAKRFRKRVDLVGPAVYLKFDPYRMRTDPDMTAETEQNWIANWHTEYALRYPLVLLGDNTLHDRCGVDPALPTLPAYAVVDGKGRLRYVRVGGSAWATQAVEAMIVTVLEE